MFQRQFCGQWKFGFSNQLPTLIADPSVFYFFSTAQNILKFCRRTIGTFASHIPQKAGQKSQFFHPPQNENDRLKDENLCFNQLKLNFN